MFLFSSDGSTIESDFSVNFFNLLPWPNKLFLLNYKYNCLTIDIFTQVIVMKMLLPLILSTKVTPYIK